LINNLIKTVFFDLANYKDIAAMKLWAIQKRATNKDYVDLYYILQKIDLEDLINCFFIKF
jgi:predicted nucleotidyltransferase component of viral defense system